MNRGRGVIGPAAALVALVALAGAPAAANMRPDAAPPSLVGRSIERVEQVAYAAGEARAWPGGAGVQATVVVSGRITVYGLSGEGRVYEHGQGFAAGWEPYRTVNESAQPVRTLTTFHAGPQ